MKTSIWLPKRAGAREHDAVRGIDYVWRPTVAHQVLTWMQSHLRHVKGPDTGKPIRFSDWQSEFFSALYGWRVYGHEDWCRYRRAYLEVPRGNGKTTKVAAAAVKRLFGRKGVMVIGVASDREQANIVFADAAAMVRADRALSDAIDITDSTRRMRRIGDHGGRYLVLSSEDHRAEGYHPDLIIFDELHAQRDRGLWDVLSTSQINLPDALMFAITTAGDDRESICWKVHEMARSACEDRMTAPDMLAAIYAAEDGDDIEDPKVWKKANPNLGVSVMEAEIRAKVAEAKRDPLVMSTVMRYHFDVWQQPQMKPIRLEDWDACGGMVDETALEARTAYGGLDVAQVNDLTAFALAFPADDGSVDLLMRFWVPEATIAKNHAYAEYVARGLITPTPGSATRFDFIREEIVRLFGRFRIAEIGYDKWAAYQLAQELSDHGLEMVEMRQGFVSMSEPTKAFLRLVLDRRIRHGGNAVLRWNVDNLVVIQDAPGNIKPDKSKASGKIDGAVAAIMAVGRAVREREAGLFYVA